MYSRQKKEVNYLSSLSVKDIEGTFIGRLRNKVWKLERLEPKVNCDDSEGSRQLQHKVWDPGGMKTVGI